MALPVSSLHPPRLSEVKAVHAWNTMMSPGMMDGYRKTEGGASSEPAFDVSQVCPRVRGLFGLTSEFVAAVQIDCLDGLEAPNDVRRSLSYLLSRGEGDCDTTLFEVLGLAFQQEHKLQRCYATYGYSMVSVSESTMPSAK